MGYHQGSFSYLNNKLQLISTSLCLSITNPSPAFQIAKAQLISRLSWPQSHFHSLYSNLAATEKPQHSFKQQNPTPQRNTHSASPKKSQSTNRHKFHNGWGHSLEVIRVCGWVFLVVLTLVSVIAVMLIYAFKAYDLIHLRFNYFILLTFFPNYKKDSWCFHCLGKETKLLST